MTFNDWVSLVGDFGCAALFFSLCLGLIGLPLPNEAVVASAGALAGAGMLPFGPAFLATYLGTVSGLTFGYAMGRKFGPRLAERISGRSGAAAEGLRRSGQLVSRYGNFTLLFSYFLPVVRHLVPYWAGAHRFAYRRFALYAYFASFVWTAVYFAIGSSVGLHARDIGDVMSRYGMHALWFIAVTGACWGIIRSRRLRSLGRQG